MSLKQFTPPLSILRLSSDRNKFVCFFFYSVFLLFFLSPDSYLYDVYFRCDSAWFFTCGKAWMNGMIPYVDFADSKGPLLWLIYGIGYLLNSHSYVGVFWVSCMFYAVSFTFAYKISRLYLDRKGATLVLALLPAFLFYKGLHYEVRAEDFCNTFIFISLYSLCRIQKEYMNKRQLFKYAFAMGASMTCCLLIKWNYFFMIGGMALVVLFVSIRKNTLSGLWGGLVGIAMPAIPFLVYFLIQGNFEAFVSEYFINTSATVGINSAENFVRGPLFGYNRKLQILFIASIILFCYKHKGHWGVLFSLLVFVCLLALGSLGYYYYTILPFSIYLLITAVEYMQKKFELSKRKVITMSFCIIICSTIINLHYIILRKGSIFTDNKEYRQSYYDISHLMATVKKPKVMFLQMEKGHGVLADALPACKYWAQQNGATPAMFEERQKAIQERKPDFLFAEDNSHEYYIKQYNLTPAELYRLGYVYCGNCVGEFFEGKISAYCKKELYRKLPPVKLRTIDLLLKRDILSGNSETK